MSGWTLERHEAVKAQLKDLEDMTRDEDGCDLERFREHGEFENLADELPDALAEIERLRELLKDAQDSLDVEGILEEGERDIWR